MNDEHLANYADFLPMDPNVVVFSDTPDVTRAAQEERIRVMNELSTRSPLTAAQRGCSTDCILESWPSLGP